MVRKRVPLQLIPKDTSRRRTYRSRKNNLMKKAHEFRTLCGVSTCVIIYDPEDPTKQPETYPKERDQVVEVIEKYVSTGGKKKMLGLPKFFEDRKKKAESELKKVREENSKAKYPMPRDLIEGLSSDQLRSLCHELSVKIVRAKNWLGVGGINGVSTAMTSNNNNNNNLGVGLETPSSAWLDSQLNQLGGEVAWSASNKGNSYMKSLFDDLPSTQTYFDIPPIQCQFPGQDQYDVSSLRNPNTDYTRSGPFCNPPFLQYKAHGNLFVQSPQPLMQYMGPTGFSDLPPLPGSSHNFDQYNSYGVYGSADVASSGLLGLPAAKIEWQKEQLSSADLSFYNQYYYRA